MYCRGNFKLFGILLLAWAVNFALFLPLRANAALFSPGDRVVARVALICSDCSPQCSVLRGTTGTVICYDASDPQFPYLVRWDNGCNMQQQQQWGVCIGNNTTYGLWGNSSHLSRLPSCSYSYPDLCTNMNDCYAAGLHWCNNHCQRSECSDCGLLKNPPSFQEVGFCDSGCQKNAPMQVSNGYLDVCFNYTHNVHIIAGLISPDFNDVWWLHPDCKLSGDYNVINGNLSCPGIGVPAAVLDGGYAFWLVTVTDLSHLDWDNGIYELLFYEIKQSCPMEINGVCINCDTNCAGVFGADIPSVIQCAYWKDSNCGSPSPPPSQKVAVVVGISDYKDNTSNPNTGEPYIPDLDYADDDARSMRELLHGDGWQVILLTDSSGTKAAIRDQINNNISDASKFLFFFAGHGTAEGSIGYIEPYDSHHNGYSNSISEDELESWLLSGGSNAEIGVILDGCHSGSFIGREISRGEKAKRIYNRFATKANVDFVDPRAGEFFARDLARNGWVVLTASKGSEISWESGGISHGYLTYYLLSALKNINNDNNSNGSISIEEAYDEIRGLGNIGDLQYPQHPQLYDGNGYYVDFDVLQLGN